MKRDTVTHHSSAMMSLIGSVGLECKDSIIFGWQFKQLKDAAKQVVIKMFKLQIRRT